jgi:hypothetical protein
MTLSRPIPALSTLFVIACLASACAGAGPGATTGTGNAGPSEPAAGNTAEPGGGTARPGTGGDSGATIRLVNVWAEQGKLGPSVRLRVFGDADSPPLSEVAPGQVGQFVAIPKAQFGDSAATLEVIPATAGAEERGISIQGFNAGDRVTVAAHGNLQDGTVGLAIHTTWEVGEPALGLPWPSIAPEKAILMVYPGALMTLPDADAGVALAKADGTCLTKDNGEQETGGFGGNVEQYYALDAGSTELDVAASPGASCQLEPDIGTVTINAAAGQRVALLPWGQGKGQIQLLVIDMGTP